MEKELIVKEEVNYSAMVLTPNNLLKAQSELKENVASLSSFNSIKAVVIARSNSTPVKKGICETGHWYDMETEVSLGPDLECSVLALKYLAKVTSKKDKTYVDSMILPPSGVRWTENLKLAEFREKYSKDEKTYKFEEGADLLVYIPTISQFRHIFCKGALSSSVDGILTSCAQSDKLAIVTMHPHRKGSDDKEWYHISSKWVKDNDEVMRALDKLLETFFKVTNKESEDLEVTNGEREPEKVGTKKAR